MQLSFLPKTALGRWSFGLAAACIVLLVLLVVLVGGLGLGIVKRGTLGANMLGFAFGISGIAALVTGLVSITKRKERSILVFVAVVGTGIFIFMFLIFLIGEEVLSMGL